MIDAIGEATVQQTTRIEHGLAENNRSVAAGETERAAIERPVEAAGSGEAAGDPETEDKSRTRYNIENNRLIIEQYGKNGQLILQLPPVHFENA